MSDSGFLLIVGVWLIAIASWFTHIIHCLLEAKYLLLIVGACIAPIGMAHGVGLWFGINW